MGRISSTLDHDLSEGLFSTRSHLHCFPCSHFFHYVPRLSHLLYFLYGKATVKVLRGGHMLTGCMASWTWSKSNFGVCWQWFREGEQDPVQDGLHYS